MDRFAQKIFTGWGLFAILIIVLAGGFIFYKSYTEKLGVNNYKECVAAGNPVLTTSPEQCISNGNTYTNTTQEDKTTL